MINETDFFNKCCSQFHWLLELFVEVLQMIEQSRVITVFVVFVKVEVLLPKMSKNKINSFNNVIVCFCRIAIFINLRKHNFCKHRVIPTLWKRESQVVVHVQNNNYLMQSSLALSGFVAALTSGWRQCEEKKNTKAFIYTDLFIKNE